MLKILVKKQLLGLFRNFFVDQKRGKAKTPFGSILAIALYAILMVAVFGGMFFSLASSLCAPLSGLGLEWMYYAMMSLIAVVLGVFGSVFSTYAGLYQAKDNDLLLSLPIPVPVIMASRLLGVYLMGLMFSGAVMIPAVAAYLMENGITFSGILGGICLILMVSLFVLLLSCCLGWVVAKISSKLKNKSLMVVAVSLAFIGGYYYVYFRATELLGEFLANAASIRITVTGAIYPLYVVGRIGQGSIWDTLLAAAVLGCLLVFLWKLMMRSFVKLATASDNTSPKKYQADSSVQKSAESALLRKELGKFLANPSYVLNCGLGTILMPIAAVLILLNGSTFLDILNVMFPEDPGVIPVLVCTSICAVCSTNDMATPSVSLDAKNLWISQSLPVSPWQILWAKLKLQIFLTGIPALLVTVSFLIALPLNAVTALLILLHTVIFVLLQSCYDLLLGLKLPNLSWTSETFVIKQSMAVFAAIFGCWIFATVFAGSYLLFASTVLSAQVYLTLFTVAEALLTVLLYRWLKTRGCEIFAGL